MSPILVPQFVFSSFFAVFAGYSGPLCLKPPGSGLPHNPALPDPPRLSYPSGGVRKSVAKKDIHPQGFGEYSVTPLLNGLSPDPSTSKIQNPKSKPFSRILDFANFARFWPLHKQNCLPGSADYNLPDPANLSANKTWGQPAPWFVSLEIRLVNTSPFCYTIGYEFTCLVTCFVKCVVYRGFALHMFSRIWGENIREPATLVPLSW